MIDDWFNPKAAGTSAQLGGPRAAKDETQHARVDRRQSITRKHQQQQQQQQQ